MITLITRQSISGNRIYILHCKYLVHIYLRICEASNIIFSDKGNGYFQGLNEFLDENNLTGDPNMFNFYSALGNSADLKSNWEFMRKEAMHGRSIIVHLRFLKPEMDYIDVSYIHIINLLFKYSILP